jgi:hypothetical protein
VCLALAFAMGVQCAVVGVLFRRRARSQEDADVAFERVA